jgi:hypothetical protein
MNSFDINRFGKTFRWVLATNFRNFLAWTLGAAVGVFLMEIILIAFNVHPDRGNYISELRYNISQICTIALMIFVLVALSTGFSDYSKKPQREAFLMLPSTNLEKFLSVVIYITVVWSLAGFLAFAVGDTLRMVVRALAYGNEWYSLVPRMLKNMFYAVSPEVPDNTAIVTTAYKVTWIFFFFSSLFWIHSLYILGGTLLRKYSFVVSSLVGILFVMLYVWVGRKFDLRGFYTEAVNDAKSALVYYKVGALGYGLCVLFPLFSIFNYWASFHIFKGFQLITNKWTNYDILKR